MDEEPTGMGRASFRVKGMGEKIVEIKRDQGSGLALVWFL